MTPDDAIRELCRRAALKALTAMFRIVVDQTAAPSTRLRALRRVLDLVNGKVVSLTEFRAAMAVADVSGAEWVGAVRELRAGRR